MDWKFPFAIFSVLVLAISGFALASQYATQTQPSFMTGQVILSQDCKGETPFEKMERLKLGDINCRWNHV